jgi:hypothetical protein
LLELTVVKDIAIKPVMATTDKITFFILINFLVAPLLGLERVKFRPQKKCLSF